MSDQDDPFNEDEIKQVLSGDVGINRILNAMPNNQAAGIRSLMTNQSFIKMFLNLLPEDYRNKAINLFDAIATVPDQAIRLFREGRFFEVRTLLLKAIELYEYKADTAWGFLNQAVDFSTKRARALLFHLLGEVEWALGNAERAGYCYGCVLDLARETDDPDTIAKALLGLGIYHGERGEYGEAFEYCEQAFEIMNGKPEDPWRLKPKILNAMGGMCSSIGELEKAHEFACKALEITREMGDLTFLPYCLNNLAGRLVDIQEYEAALDALYEGLNIIGDDDDPCLQALMLCNLADVHVLCYGPEEDVPGVGGVHVLYERALHLGEQTQSRPTQAMAMRSLGQLAWHVGDYAEAEQWLTQALEIYRRIGAGADETGTLLDLGMLMWEGFDDLNGACRMLGSCIEILETIRGGLRREPHRIAFAHQGVEPYALMVECLIKLVRFDEAFNYVERAKSRAMLDFLGAGLRERAPLKTDDETFKRALRLLTEMDELRTALEALKRGQEGGDEQVRGSAPDVTLSQVMLDELQSKENEFADAYAEFSAVDPQSASLMRVMPLQYDQLVHGMDAQTLILNLFQTDSSLHLFLVGHDASVQSLSIPITAAEADDIVWNLTRAMQDGSTYDVRAHDYLLNVRRPLSDLYDRLIRPISGLLTGYRRIIIAPHLFWHYLPFHALYDREQKGFLCDTFEVGYCPSAAVLRLCLAKEKTARNRALIMARNKGDLPYADREADMLRSLFDPDAVIFKGDMAHLHRVQEHPAGYDLVHLACHGVFDSAQPFLSGIDMPPNAGEGRRTYLLDLFDLHLDCTQVTLSACESGLSQFTLADELTGLSRGLFYAGASAVMLSLWKVGDESSCELMRDYYRHYVKERHTKTRALQLAMQALKARPEYAHPRFWAPFVIIGDWR